MPGLLPLTTPRWTRGILERPYTRRSVAAVGLGLSCAGLATALTIPRDPARAGTDSDAVGCDPGMKNPGLLEDDAWQGPTFGLAVSWDPLRWNIGERSNPGVAKVIGREDQPIDCGFGQGGSDRLTLANTMWESGVLVIESYDRGMWTLPQMEEAMSQPGWATNLHIASTSDLLLSGASDDAVTAVAGDDETPEHTVYWQAIFPEDDDSVIHQITLHMWEAGAVYALHDLEGVEVDGIDLFAVADLETVRQVIDDYLAANRDAIA